MSSNYPPGVTGSEPEIASDAAFEKIYDSIDMNRDEMIKFIIEERDLDSQEAKDVALASDDDLLDEVARIQYDKYVDYEPDPDDYRENED